MFYIESIYPRSYSKTMSIPEILNQLTDRFRDNIDAYKSSGYNEARLRGEFINPFFEALGWDIYNKQGYAEAYKDVIHEDAIKVGGATKAPDYSFRIGGVRRFFLETKKPSLNLKDDPEPAFQLRRYAWSAKLPLSILTDFEEFAVYDCRIKPSANDKASTGRIMYFTYKEYAEKWEAITSVFSREAILKGSFDRFVESEKKKRGTAEVDDAFLKEIESWRDALARNIALRNSALTERDVNYAVQLTIDRIIFLRICEDRGIEDYGRLQALLNGEHVYRRLVDLYYRADEKYNSGLFHFQSERGRPGEPDELTTGLKIDDKVLKDIIRGLYYPESPYEFSVLPVDILGHVYERFLGKVIRLTPGGRAKVEEKPEVRKAGGVYYTPKYIVDYIVENTVGRLLWGAVGNRKSERGNRKEQLTPVKASKLRILDPACGSGSFLIGAYEYLLNWHRDWYVENDPSKHTKQIYRGAGDQWYLTTAEKKRILLNNIYGVDIDAQAVEVTKLNLLLKTLEGESGETIESQLKMFRERALPDLRGNIKCGNSLIGPDFYDSTQLDLLDDEERYRINAFDWEREFGEVMKGGGFDAVIGNPPYVFIIEVPEDHRRYYERTYKGVGYRFDLYGVFIEKSKYLLNKRGKFGFIIPHTLLSNDSFNSLRQIIARELWVYKIVDLGPGVFQGAKNETMLLFFSKENPEPNSLVDVVRSDPKIFPSYKQSFLHKQHEWMGENGEPWLVHVSPEIRLLLEKMNRASLRLGTICTINQGCRTGNNEKYLNSKEKSSKWKKAAGGKDIGRYEPINIRTYVYYDTSVLDAPRRPEIFFSSEKLLVQEIRNISLPRRIVATFDKEKIIGLQSTNVINKKPGTKQDLRYILGVLNSNLVNTYFRLNFPGNNHIPSNQLAKIPIPDPDKSRYKQMVLLVDKMLDLHKKLAFAKSAPEKTAILRQINATDKQIDELVYELYGLTEEEKRIVEGDAM